MRTFTEKLAETRNLRSLVGCCEMIAECGADPDEFIEWLSTEADLSREGFEQSANLWIEASLWTRMKQGALTAGGLGAVLGNVPGALLGGAVGGLAPLGWDLYDRFKKWASIDPATQKSYEPSRQDQAQYRQRPVRKRKVAVGPQMAINDLVRKIDRAVKNNPELGKFMADPNFAAAMAAIMKNLESQMGAIVAAPSVSPSGQAAGGGQQPQQVQQQSVPGAWGRPRHQDGADATAFYQQPPGETQVTASPQPQTPSHSQTPFHGKQAGMEGLTLRRPDFEFMDDHRALDTGDIETSWKYEKGFKDPLGNLDPNQLTAQHIINPADRPKTRFQVKPVAKEEDKEKDERLSWRDRG